MNVAAIGRMHSTAAGIDGLPTCLLRPRLLPAAQRAGAGWSSHSLPAVATYAGPHASYYNLSNTSRIVIAL
jgi:hypothetical protein